MNIPDSHRSPKNPLRFLPLSGALLFSAFIVMGDSLNSSSSHLTAIDKEYNMMLDSCEYYISRNHWKEAEESVRKCLRKYPASPLNGMLFYNLGMAQIGQEKYPEAEESFSLALVRDENNPQYLLGRARCRLLMKEPASAEEDLNLILSTDSLNFEALYNRSVSSRMEGKIEMAAEDLSRILRHQPEDLPALSSLGEIMINQGNYTEAESVLSKALQLHSASHSETDTSADDRFMLIMAYLGQEKDSEAEETIREALKSFPRDGRFYMTRAILSRKRFQNHDAALDKKIASQYGVDSQILDYFLPDIR